MMRSAEVTPLYIRGFQQRRGPFRQCEGLLKPLKVDLGVNVQQNANVVNGHLQDILRMSCNSRWGHAWPMNFEMVLTIPGIEVHLH